MCLDVYMLGTSSNSIFTLKNRTETKETNQQKMKQQKCLICYVSVVFRLNPTEPLQNHGYTDCIIEIKVQFRRRKQTKSMIPEVLWKWTHLIPTIWIKKNEKKTMSSE